VSVTFPTRKLAHLGDGGVMDDAQGAADAVDRELPQTAFGTPVTQVFDLADHDLTITVLRHLIVPLGQRLRGGVYGNARVVFTTRNAAVAEVISLLAREHDLPIFLASTPADVDRAQPAGELTASEAETLQQLHLVGGRVTASALASSFGIAANAANNRLSNLERKGYLLRVRRGRRAGDEYLDPRADLPDVQELRRLAVKPMRAVLMASGIETDPYDRTPIVLEGEGAERAAEILRRRGKAQ
jgi:hypothetical protein